MGLLSNYYTSILIDSLLYIIYYFMTLMKRGLGRLKFIYYTLGAKMATI